MSRCVSVRTANSPKKLPGQQRVYRCRNKASRAVRVLQSDEHLRIGTGWYEVELCEICFFASDSNALVWNSPKERQWKNLA